MTEDHEIEYSIRDKEEWNVLISCIHRLSAQLSLHQHTNGQMSMHMPGTDGADIPQQSIIPSVSVMSPLFAEYDKIIQKMTQEKSIYHHEIENLSEKIAKITNENERLHYEIVNSFERKLSENEDTIDKNEDLQTKLIESLKQQNISLTRERDCYSEKWKSASQELIKCQEINQTQSQQIIELNSKLISMNEELQYTRANNNRLINGIEEEANVNNGQLARKTNELQILQTEFEKANTQLNMYKIQTEQLTKKCEYMSSILDTLKSEKEEHIRTDLDLVQEKKGIWTELKTKDQVIRDQQREILTLQEEKAEFERSLINNSKKMSEIEARKSEAISHVKQSIEMVDNAMFEKEKSDIEAKQASSEIIRLKEILTEVMKNAGVKAKQTVDSVKMECNDNIGKMATEIKNLEEELTAKRIENERLSKEKHNLERELEKSKKENLSQNLENVRALQNKLTSVETQKELSNMKTESSLAELNQVKEKLDLELKQSKNSKQRYKQEKERLQFTIEEQKKIQTDLAKKSTELKDQLEDAKIFANTLEKNFDKKSKTFESELKMIQQKFQSQIEGMNSKHREETESMRSLISSQKNLSIKYRDGAKSILENSTKTIKKLEDDSKKYKKLNEQLKMEFSKLNLSNNATCDKIDNLERQKETLIDNLYEANEQIEVYSQKITQYMTQERKFTQDHHLLQKQLNRLQVQSNRPMSHSRLVNSNNLSINSVRRSGAEFIPPAPTINETTLLPQPNFNNNNSNNNNNVDDDDDDDHVSITNEDISLTVDNDS